MINYVNTTETSVRKLASDRGKKTKHKGERNQEELKRKPNARERERENCQTLVTLKEGRMSNEEGKEKK